MVRSVRQRATLNKATGMGRRFRRTRPFYVVKARLVTAVVVRLRFCSSAPDQLGFHSVCLRTISPACAWRLSFVGLKESHDFPCTKQAKSRPAGSPVDTKKSKDTYHMKRMGKKKSCFHFFAYLRRNLVVARLVSPAVGLAFCGGDHSQGGPGRWTKNRTKHFSEQKLKTPIRQELRHHKAGSGDFPDGSWSELTDYNAAACTQETKQENQHEITETHTKKECFEKRYGAVRQRRPSQVLTARPCS